jgi:8-hydroxy-5-deazaflavin:NADPH oxidoreductase
MKKIGILGAGQVGQILAAGFITDGYEVMVGSRNGHRAAMVDEALGMDVAVDTFSVVAAWAELVIIAVKGSAAEGVVGDVAEHLTGKVVIDVTNPISDDAPQSGVLSFFTSLDESLAERLQAAAPEARVVKAWNSCPYKHMMHPAFAQKPTMPICGNDAEARKEVAELVRSFGWDVEDMGQLIAARAIEPLAMLISIPGYLRGEWDHAFCLVRK